MQNAQILYKNGFETRNFARGGWGGGAVTPKIGDVPKSWRLGLNPRGYRTAGCGPLPITEERDHINRRNKYVGRILRIYAVRLSGSNSVLALQGLWTDGPLRSKYFRITEAMHNFFKDSSPQPDDQPAPFGLHACRLLPEQLRNFTVSTDPGEALTN